PTATLGTLGNDAVDMYRLNVPEPLAPGEVIEIHLENLDATPSSPSTHGASVTLHDGLGQPLPRGVLSSSGHNVRVYIPGAETQSSDTFFVEVKEVGFLDHHRYLLSVRVVEQPTDNEPNDTRESADEAGSLPITWA